MEMDLFSCQEPCLLFSGERFQLEHWIKLDLSSLGQAIEKKKRQKKAASKKYKVSEPIEYARWL